MIVPVFKLKPHTLGVPSILATPGQLVTLDKSGRASLELIWQQLEPQGEKWKGWWKVPGG